MLTEQGFTEKLEALKTADIPQLRHDWQAYFGQAPPPRLGRDLLMRALAWKLQTDHYGGLSLALKRRLKGKISPTKKFKTGTRLMREWRGKIEVVEVIETGFFWSNKTYKSLSAVARAITGTRWSGPRFFGLDGKAKKP